MNGDDDEYAQSWQHDRRRRPIGRQLQYSLTRGLAGKAGLRSFAGRSTADDPIPGPRGPGVGATLPFYEVELLAERETCAARFQSPCVWIVRVGSSPPCGGSDSSN